jgi:hypothetical protein
MTDQRSDREPNQAADSANERNQQPREPQYADDRGGSRDGERLEVGDAGDREQLDNDGGRTPSRR